jgi:hypothetical protein
VLTYLLPQTAKAGAGGWTVVVDKDGDAAFCLLYRALGASLDAPRSSGSATG